MEDRLRSLGPSFDERTMRLIVGALGVFHVLEGLWQLLLPGSFYHRIGMYGVENTHYVGDVGSFVLAFGIALLLAAGRRSWRAPVLATGALWYLFHGLNHLFDIGEARSDLRGAADTFLLLLGAVLIAGLAFAAAREDRRQAPYP